MRRRVRTALVATGLLGAMMMVSPSAAFAAHCVDDEGTTPGHSYFGTDHVQESDHSEGIEPGHAGTPGASNCREASDPSERAPGRR